MRDDAAELGRVSFHFHESSAKRRLLLMFGQRLLEQTTKTVLLPLDPQKVLNLLACACTRDLRIQKRAPQKLSSGEPSGIREGIETGNVFIPHAYTDEMAEITHTKIISIAISLSRKNVASVARISRRR